ncbi:MAG: hypothetical protein H0T14_02730 [Nocardioidaceae bacterium]|nr:hypothetical protein [Nocardioidaceae bacterium]
MTSLEELIADSWFPFAGDMTVKPLDAKVIPEPHRHGVTPETCRACQRSDETYVWTDENWRLTGVQPTELPGIVILETREHHDSFIDLPPNLLTQLGPLIARIETALLRLGDIARVHVNRWGDGGAHFHVWFMARPLGMLQLRGSMLPLWLDFLPTVEPRESRTALSRIAAIMAEQGGSAHI